MLHTMNEGIAKGLAAVIVGLLLAAPTMPTAGQGPPNPPGDNALVNLTVVPLTLGQQARVFAAVAAVYGPGSSEYQALTQAVGDGKVNLVNITGATKGDVPLGRTDATTIGFDFGDLIPLELGVVAAHELQHWLRARPGAEQSGNPATGDPCTSGSDVVTAGGALANPCAFFAHVKMAKEDLESLSEKICHELCVPDKTPICDNWDDWVQKVCDAVGAAEHGFQAGGGTAQFNGACTANITDGGSCGDQIDGAKSACDNGTYAPDKPPCCDPNWTGNDPCDP